jgi:hypothetical protein
MDCDLPTDCITRASFVPAATDFSSNTADSFLTRPSTLQAAPEKDNAELIVEENSEWTTSNDKEVNPVLHFDRTLTDADDENKETTIISTERPSRVEKLFEKGYGGAPVLWTVSLLLFESWCNERSTRGSLTALFRLPDPLAVTSHL